MPSLLGITVLYNLNDLQLTLHGQVTFQKNELSFTVFHSFMVTGVWLYSTSY